MPSGIYERTEEHKKNISLAMKGRMPKNIEMLWTVEAIRKSSEARKGKSLSVEHRKKLSMVRMGWVPSNETRQKISLAHVGMCPSNETRKKISKALKGRRKSKEHIRKCLCRRTPTSLEREFEQIVLKNGLPYKFVGDGSFLLDNLNPDFINTNGEKVAIEVYARYYKNRDGRTVREWKKKRRVLFEKYGWKILFFSENEIEEDYVLKSLPKEVKIVK